MSLTWLIGFDRFNSTVMFPEYTDIEAVILAGGKNSRYGGLIKSREIVDGKMIIASEVETLRKLFCKIIIATNTPQEFTDLTDVSFCVDTYIGKGPLGGIHAGLKASQGNAVFIVAGDMPRIDPEIIKSQVDDFIINPCEVSVPVINGNIEPLHAVYLTSLENRLASFLSESAEVKVRSFLEKIKARYFIPGDTDKAARSFININTPGEAEKTGFIKQKNDTDIMK